MMPEVSAVLLIWGMLASAVCFVYGAGNAIMARQVSQSVRKSGILMLLGVIGIAFLLFCPAFYLGGTIENKIIYVLFTRVRSMAIHHVHWMILISICLLIPPKQVGEDGKEIPSPKRKGCLIGLVLAGVVFLGICVSLFYALLGFTAKSKRSRLFSETKAIYTTTEIYQTEADQSRAFLPLGTHIRKIGSVGDEFDSQLEKYFPDAKGSWCAVVMAEEGNLYAPPAYVLYSEKEITSYESMSDDKQAVGCYP